MKKCILLDSSAISALSYDSETKDLEVEFREGNSYRYFNVPQSVIDALLEADSAGAFWNQEKENYRYQRFD